MAIKFSIARWKIAEAVAAGTVLPCLFCALHAIDGSKPGLSEFEAGGITAVVILKCIEAFHAYTLS